MNTKPCPHCGRSIPAEASFCPHCAQSINQRTPSRLPKRLPKKVWLAALFFLLAAAAAASLYLANRPKTYEGIGEITYADTQGSYLIVSNVSSNLYRSDTSLEKVAGEEERYRFPLRLHVTRSDSGEDASEPFMDTVESARIVVNQPAHSAFPVACTEPEPGATNYPGAMLVTYVDFTRESASPAQIAWELQMKNGDRIRVQTELTVTPTYTHSFDWENADLSSSAALQALVDRLAEEIPPDDDIKIFLPPVVYTEPVTLPGRDYYLTGSQSGEQRTTFAAGLRLQDSRRRITYLTDLDFVGEGNGVGLSTAGRAWAKGCRFAGWQTAFLCYGEVWANATDCTFEENGIGFHFNSVGNASSDSRYTGNQFTGNTTAVLLENVPSNTIMDFSDCRFSGNETDIDNRCDHPIDTSKAVFE